jgi:hypothetical protein
MQTIKASMELPVGLQVKTKTMTEMFYRLYAAFGCTIYRAIG